MEAEALRHPFDELLARVAHNVEHHGLHITHVSPGLNDPPGPSFACTTGLTDLVGKELIVYGLPPQMTHILLNNIHHWLSDGTGNNIDEDRPYTEFTNLPIKFRECVPEKVAELVSISTRFYGVQPPVVQMVLPDKAGLFPEDEGFDHEFMDHRQPLLYVKEQ